MQRPEAPIRGALTQVYRDAGVLSASRQLTEEYVSGKLVAAQRNRVCACPVAAPGRALTEDLSRVAGLGIA